MEKTRGRKYRATVALSMQNETVHIHYVRGLKLLFLKWRMSFNLTLTIYQGYKHECSLIAVGYLRQPCKQGRQKQRFF